MHHARWSFIAGVQLAALCLSTICFAEIRAYKCTIDKQQIYFTLYSDGTPARVGVSVGVGDKASVMEDRSGAITFVETNIDGIPITFTTIESNMRAVHSRHVLDLNGKIAAPSQVSGRCERLTIQ